MEAEAAAAAKAEAAEAEAASPFSWTINADMHQWGGALDVHRIDGFLPTDCLAPSAFGPSPLVIDTAELVKGKLGVGGASLVSVRVRVRVSPSLSKNPNPNLNPNPNPNP